MTMFLRALALAHQRHEGFYPGSMSFRRNNPGNIRGKDGQFIHFSTYTAGLLALGGDVTAKITGNSRAMASYYKRHGMSYEQATFQDYINVYAPSGDNNDPGAYCRALCKELMLYNLAPTTLLSDMAKLVSGEWARIPDGLISPRKPVSAEAQVKGLERRLLTTKDESVRSFIIRLLARIKRRLGVS